MTAQKPAPIHADLPVFEELIPPGIDCDMTPAEIENVKIHLTLLEIVYFLSGSKPSTAEEFEVLINQVEDWLTSTSHRFTSGNDTNPSVFTDTTITLPFRKQRFPSWVYLHNSFSVLETLKAVSLTLSVSSKRVAKSTAQLLNNRADYLGALQRQIYENIKTNARILKSNISEPGVLGALIDLVLVGEDDGEDGQLRTELEATLDSGTLELFCGGLMESWEEGLEGIFLVAI
jgi:N-terminal acetyltransferase B complex non-catalytic subunit